MYITLSVREDYLGGKHKAKGIACCFLFSFSLVFAFVMSDDDLMNDEEDYGFEYEEDEEDEPDVQVENKYYNSKGTWVEGVFLWVDLLLTPNSIVSLERRGSEGRH